MRREEKEGGKRKRRGKERKKENRAGSSVNMRYSISHSSAFQQEDWKSSEKKDLFFKHVQLWRKGHDMPKH